MRDVGPGMVFHFKFPPFVPFVIETLLFSLGPSLFLSILLRFKTDCLVAFFLYLHSEPPPLNTGPARSFS